MEDEKVVNNTEEPKDTNNNSGTLGDYYRDRQSVINGSVTDPESNTSSTGKDNVVYNDAQKEAIEFIDKYKGYDDQGYTYQDAMNELSPEARRYVEEYNTGDDSWYYNGTNTSNVGTSNTSSMLAQSSVTQGVDFYNSVYSYAGDGDQLLELAYYLEQSAKEIDSMIADIFIQIDGMSDVWDGAAYEEFVRNCKNYSEALNGLVVLLMAFAKEFNNLYIDNDSLIDYVEKQVSLINTISLSTGSSGN